MSDPGKTEVQVVGAEPKPEVKIVKIKSRFAMLALQPGGKPATAALAAADKFLRDERSRYHAWLGDALTALDATLDELPGTIPEALHQAYGQAMQIRDLGGTFGAPLVTEAADSLCELLYRLHAAGLYSPEAITTHLSVLRLFCLADQSRGTPADSAALLAGLRKVTGKFPRPLPPAKPDAGQPAAH